MKKLWIYLCSYARRANPFWQERRYAETLDLLGEVSRDLAQAQAEVKRLRKEREDMDVTARLSGLRVIFAPLAERGTVIMHPDDMRKERAW